MSRCSDSKRVRSGRNTLNTWNRLGRRGNLGSHFFGGEFVRCLETGRLATDSDTFLVILLLSNGHYVCKLSPSSNPHLKTVSPSLLDPAIFRVLSELFTLHTL